MKVSDEPTRRSVIVKPSVIGMPELLPKKSGPCYICINVQRRGISLTHSWTLLPNTQIFLFDITHFIPGMHPTSQPMARLAKNPESNGRSNQWPCPDDSVRLVLILLCEDTTKGFFSWLKKENRDTPVYKEIKVDLQVLKTDLYLFRDMFEMYAAGE